MLSKKKWFVVHTKPRQEKIAVQNLQRQGYMTYCPYTILSKRRNHRWQNIIEPLFPRYLFVQLNMGVDNFSPIRSTLGVVNLVRFGDLPAMIPNSTIELIQIQENNLMECCDDYPSWLEGDILEIGEGPLSGFSGVFLKKDGGERVLLLMDMLGKQNRLSINANNLKVS